jgi:2-C-methyl-D-erythritol 4-phosphate cytidylyltransferase
MTQKISIILTAGGIGKRMGADRPKQFLLLDGKPVLMQTLVRLNAMLPEAQIVITLPQEWKEEWRKLCVVHHCLVIHEVVDGGFERFHSVKNALQICSGEKVLIHDGVRPLIASAVVKQGLELVREDSCAVPCTTVNDSMRKLNENGNQYVQRNDYRLIQTPQVFLTKEIVKAYDVLFDNLFTDDASVYERAGGGVNLFEGNKENIKITTKEDLEYAEYIWKKRLAISDPWI